MITIIMGVGTTQKGNVLTIERMRRSRMKSLRRRLAGAAPDRQHAIQDEIQHLERDLILIAADLDGIDGLDIPEPLENDDNVFPATANLPVFKPGFDTIEKIKLGLLGGYDFVNPEAYKLMQADRNGTGGTRPNGRLTIEAARSRVKEVVAGVLNEIAQRRREAAVGRHETTLIILMYSSFGGFASGAHEVVQDIWEHETSERQFPVQILPLLLVPHGFPPDDAFNTNSVSYGVIKELTANATKRRHRREFRKGENRKIVALHPFRQTLLLSDTTLAGGQPRTVPRRNFNGMVAQLAMDLATTAAGERLIAKLTDFNAGGQSINCYGETRHGVTIGFSSIVLDRERLFLYMAARLRRLFGEQAVQVVDEAAVLHDDRGFLEGRHIVEGDGREDLANHLHQVRLANDLVSPERTAELFRVNASRLTGVTLLRHGAEALEAAIQQNGDLAAALAARGRSVVESSLAAVDDANRAMAGDPQRRLGLAWQRTDSLAAIVANMANLSAADTTVLQEQVTTADGRVQHYHDVYIPDLERKTFLYRFLHRRRIQGEAEDYRRSLLALYLARCRLLAHQAAVEVLNALHQPLKDRADRLQSCLKTVNDEITAAKTEGERLAAHSSDMECPVGLPLLASPELFDVYHNRLLPETDYDAAIATVYARLRESEDLLSVLSDQTQLRVALDIGCEDVLRNRVEVLHVANELRLRYNTPETLGPVMRERDFESTERLVLHDSVDAEQRPVLVRLLATDSAAVGNLLDTLNEYAQPRGHNYTLLNTGDRDRIVVFQIRAGFALSDWVRTTDVSHDYAQAAKVSRIERHHTTPGARALPEIGRLRTAEDNRLTAIRAWLLDRLHRDQSGNWLLKPVDSAFADEHIGSKMELLAAPDGYAMAVDVASHFECRYFESGNKAFEDGLARLKNKPADACADEKEIAKLFDAAIEERFRQELAWWSDNTMPGAMDWRRAKAREALGVMV